MTADYNLYYTVDGASAGTWTWLGTAVSGFSSHQSISGMDADSLFADPLYSSLTTPDFDISASSPAVNAGSNLGASVVGTVDFAGNARVTGTQIDIGAYQQ